MKMVPLGEVALIERTGVDPTQVDTDARYIGLEHIERGGRITSDETVGSSAIKSTKFRFTPKHLLFGKLRPNLGKIARPEEAGVCSTDILPVLPGPSLNRDFLFHYLSQPKIIAFAASQATGANLPRLSPKTLEAMEIPLPPLDEQRRIAAILDRADELLADSRVVQAAVEELERATFLELFGHPMTNRVGWPVVRIDDVCTLVRGSSPRPQGDPRFFGGPVPRLMISDITRDGKLVVPRTDSLTEEGAKRSRPCPRGTVVMAVSGNIGLASILAVDACIHDGFVGFTELAEDRVLPRFLLEVLRESKAVHDRSQAGAIFKNITTTDIKKMEIINPPLEKQLEFLKRVAAVERFADGTMKCSSELEKLRRSLADAAFRGDLSYP